MPDQTNLNDESAKQWLDILLAMKRCAWCGEDEKPLNRAGLCSSCKGVETHIAKAKRKADELLPTASRHEEFLLKRAIEVAELAKEHCILDGEAVVMILRNEDLLTADLEHTFDDVAFAICHKRRVYGAMATRLGWTFSPKQRQVLAYLFWKAFHTDEKRKRMQIASNRLIAMKARADARDQSPVLFGGMASKQI
jgi:hypothetical protein